MQTSTYLSLMLNNILTVWIFFVISLVASLIIKVFSAYIIYKDAKARGHLATYWCIYDIFISSFSLIGIASYYFFVVKPYNTNEMNNKIGIPPILIVKLIYKIIFSIITSIILIDLFGSMSFLIGIAMIYSIIGFILLIPNTILFILKLLAINKLYSDCRERFKSECLTWSIFSIFFPLLTLIIYMFAMKRTPKKAQPVGQLSLLPDTVIQMDDKIPTIFIVYVLVSSIGTFMSFVAFLMNIIFVLM